jgi:glycosyltransferase involved in cell wall biosynthesis
MPQWSIVLPVHSSVATVGIAIESALSQTSKDFELLVLGDGCDAETRAVIETYVDPRIRFSDNPKAVGFGYIHRRVAIEQAGGEYIAFLSDDDLWAPTHLADLGVLLDAGHAFAYSRPIWCVPTGELVPLAFDLTDATMSERFGTTNHIPSVFCAASRHAIAAVGGWPADVPEAADWLLWKRILALPGSTAGLSRNASALHFRAGRRDYDHPAVAEVLQFIGRERWWPHAATVDQGAHETLQAAIAGVASDEWWADLNKAVATIVDHLALEGARLSEQLAAELAGAKDELASAKGELAALRSSRSWRVTRPLRAIRSRRAQDTR